MATVTIIKNLPQAPSKVVAKQVVGQHLGELFDMWMKYYGKFIAGKRFAVLAFAPGEYAPSKGGPVRNDSPFVRGGGPVAYAFAISDDVEAGRSPHCLWMIDPDPAFFPDGV